MIELLTRLGGALLLSLSLALLMAWGWSQTETASTETQETINASVTPVDTSANN